MANRDELNAVTAFAASLRFACRTVIENMDPEVSCTMRCNVSNKKEGRTPTINVYMPSWIDPEPEDDETKTRMSDSVETVVEDFHSTIGTFCKISLLRLDGTYKEFPSRSPRLELDHLEKEHHRFKTYWTAQASSRSNKKRKNKTNEHVTLFLEPDMTIKDAVEKGIIMTSSGGWEQTRHQFCVPIAKKGKTQVVTRLLKTTNNWIGPTRPATDEENRLIFVPNSDQIYTSHHDHFSRSGQHFLSVGNIWTKWEGDTRENSGDY